MKKPSPVRQAAVRKGLVLPSPALAMTTARMLLHIGSPKGLARATGSAPLTILAVLTEQYVQPASLKRYEAAVEAIDLYVQETDGEGWVKAAAKAAAMRLSISAKFAVAAKANATRAAK